jgi:cell division septation protein DedD
VVQDTALAGDSLKVDADSAGIFLQVSTSQNPDWAAQLARQLKDAGFPSRVLQPKGPDDGYRVVVGPYPTRDIAEENGRKLGRPFFILRELQRHP